MLPDKSIETELRSMQKEEKQLLAVLKKAEKAAQQAQAKLEELLKRHPGDDHRRQSVHEAILEAEAVSGSSAAAGETGEGVEGKRVEGKRVDGKRVEGKRAEGERVERKKERKRKREEGGRGVEQLCELG